MSLSDVETTVRRRLAVAWAARVPITSSASTSGTIRSGIPIALMMSWIGLIWSRRSSGIGGRLALYSG